MEQRTGAKEERSDMEQRMRDKGWETKNREVRQGTKDRRQGTET
jgi:hypothetical protein